MELEFCQNIFKKSARIKLNENSSSGSRTATCGRTDGQTRRRKRRLSAALRTRLKITKNIRQNRRAPEGKTGIGATGMFTGQLQWAGCSPAVGKMWTAHVALPHLQRGFKNTSKRYGIFLCKVFVLTCLRTV